MRCAAGSQLGALTNSSLSRFCEALWPAAIELSLSAIEHTSQQRRQQEMQLQQNLDRATYEAKRAERQYQAVEPENRLVARNLEVRWETALEATAQHTMPSIDFSARSRSS